MTGAGAAGVARAGPADPLARARQVCLQGHGLPTRWEGRDRFAILHSGFGAGVAFLAAWLAWQRDPLRPHRLYVIATAAQWPSRDDLRQAHAALVDAAAAAQQTQDAAELPALCQALHAAWPADEANDPDPQGQEGLEGLDLADGRVRLLRASGALPQALRGLVAQVDAFWLQGLSPADPGATAQASRLWPALARLAAPGATLGMEGVPAALQTDIHAGLTRAGFEMTMGPRLDAVQSVAAQSSTLPPDAGPDVILARFRPRVAARPPPGRRSADTAQHADRGSLVIGAGIAGACAAHALADAGWACTVLEQAATAAAGASGNRAGLFHGTVHAEDGPHALLLQACARFAAAFYAPLLGSGRVTGQAGGLLRLDSVAPIDRTVHPGLAQRVSPAEASQRAGLPLRQGGWWFPQGGWLAPVELVHALLHNAPGITLRTNTAVQSLRRNAADTLWQALDAQGALLAEASVVVLCNAQDAARLLPGLGGVLQAVRGQVTHLAATPGLPRPPVPVAGAGYWLSLPDGCAVIGATVQPGDDDRTVRAADHLHNLDRARHLLGQPGADWRVDGGRVGWRCTAPDRLPLVGPVPVSAWRTSTMQGASESPRGATLTPPMQPRRVPRVAGLYTCTGLGSRGLTWAPLLARTLAAWISGEPWPLPSRLVDAIDPARFETRVARREASARDAAVRAQAGV